MHKLSDSIERKFVASVALSDWEIDTDSGWQPVTHIHKTIPYERWIVRTSSGKYLECADTHILFDDSMVEIFALDLVASRSKIMTVDGPELVVDCVQT